eukprot:g5299.t1
MNVTKHVKLLKNDVRIACQMYENTKLDRVHNRNNTDGDNTKQSFPIVILRGFGMTKEDSHSFASVLCEKYGHQIITVDNRGTGESDKPPDVRDGQTTFGLKDMAMDCIHLLEELELPKFNLFGASMGGYISQHIALIKPSCIHKLILACTHYGGPKCHPPTKRYEKLVSAAVPSPTEQMDEWNEYHKRLFSINFHHNFLQTDKFHHLLENFKNVQKTQVLRGKTAQRQAIKEFIEVGLECELMDRFEIDNDFGVNTLIMSGDSDNVVPVENSFLLRKCFPGSCMTIVENAGHMFWEERTEDVAKDINKFIFRKIVEYEPGMKVYSEYDSYVY